MSPLSSAASGRRRQGCGSRRLLGRSATRGGLCRRYWAKAGVGLQVVHGDDLLPLAHLDCERLGPFGDHQA
jgi:hypothetical protein